MTEPHPIMALLLEQSKFLGGAESVESEILPLPDQISFGPGDTGIMAGANTPLERDFVVVRGVEPALLRETFPDWEQRTSSGFGHVLCEAFSKDDLELTVGWYPRLKIMRITAEQYKQCRGWLHSGFPENLPDWVDDVYTAYTDALAQRAPEVVPTKTTCPNCGGREVYLMVTRKIEYRGRSGTIVVEGEERYVSVVDPDETDSHIARLTCASCSSYADLRDEEWHLPNIST